MSWQAVNLRAVEPGERPEPTIGGILYPGLRTLLSGEPESLKSWFAAVIALEELRQDRVVCWVDFEQGPAMTASRFRDLGLTEEKLAGIIYFEPREPLTEQARDELRNLLRAAPPSLTVFDSYAGLIGLDGGNPNSEADIEAVNRAVVDVFRDSGAGVLLVDHPVKAVAERGRYSSGSGRKLAEVDVHVRLERGAPFGRGKTGSSRIVVLKDRPGGMSRSTRTLTLISDPRTGAVTAAVHTTEHSDEPGSFRPTALMQRVSEWLARQFVPVSRNTVETNVRGKGEFVRLAIDVLTREGYIEETPGPSAARLVSHVKPYSETHDLVPSSQPRPNLVPDEVNDFVPRPPCLTRDEDEDSAEDELERLTEKGWSLEGLA